MTFGIDLGTTNSLIGLHDVFISKLVPSIVNLDEKTAGESLRDNYLQTTRSFKIDMSLGSEGNISVASSALVLRELVNISGYDVKDVVITVPAYFTCNQREATRKAAEMIGLSVKALVNEPTAAAMYYLKDKRSLTFVFDLGGGTFDISVVDSRLGYYDVLDTSGLVLGGDDLDKAIFADMQRTCNLKLHRATKEIQSRILHDCLLLKVQLQRTGETVNYSHHLLDKDYILTVDNYINIMMKVFKNCLIRTLEVKNRSIPHDAKFSILFVGGSTRCPYLRKWVETELRQRALPFTYNPDEIVGLGAAYYAHLFDKGVILDKVKDTLKPLGIGLIDGTIRTIIPSGSKLPISETVMVTNPDSSMGLEISLYQGESSLVKNNDKIGSLKYDFDRVMECRTANVEVMVKVDISGFITFSAKEFGKVPREIKLTN